MQCFALTWTMATVCYIGEKIIFFSTLFKFIVWNFIPKSDTMFSVPLNSYEMQVEKEYQRKGLGKFIMNALEKMARHYEMEKLILTVLSNNEDAIIFFKGLGFGADDTSPDAAENSGYQILSKLLL